MKSVQKAKVQIFLVWTKNWLIRGLLCSQNELVTKIFEKLSENFQKTYSISFKSHFSENQTKNIATQILGKSSVSSS